MPRSDPPAAPGLLYQTLVDGSTPLTYRDGVRGLLGWQDTAVVPQVVADLEIEEVIEVPIPSPAAAPLKPIAATSPAEPPRPPGEAHAAPPTHLVSVEQQPVHVLTGRPPMPFSVEQNPLDVPVEQPPTHVAVEQQPMHVSVEAAFGGGVDQFEQPPVPTSRVETEPVIQTMPAPVSPPVHQVPVFEPPSAPGPHLPVPPPPEPQAPITDWPRPKPVEHTTEPPGDISTVLGERDVSHEPRAVAPAEQRVIEPSHEFGVVHQLTEVHGATDSSVMPSPLPSHAPSEARLVTVVELLPPEPADARPVPFATPESPVPHPLPPIRVQSDVEQIRDVVRTLTTKVEQVVAEAQPQPAQFTQPQPPAKPKVPNVSRDSVPATYWHRRYMGAHLRRGVRR